MNIARIVDHLPSSFGGLFAAAAEEGVRNMDLLADGWRSGEQRFATDGEALFGAFDGAGLVGVGGVTWDIGLTETAMRMRRFYVLPQAREFGVGRALAEVAMTHGFARAPLLTCNARATPLAAPFWETMGFWREDLPNITHICRKG
ncbi:GNAT family N-acetyltransferase [Hyphomonas oceanitis]|uniref:N-acetyltransferase GCN5 n=1 Tax=Hyphomonas oceanitis SCH89 TaxID=1280953 RepID=A0A059G2E6_9PROT|nr:GNAT family N-acetyltransferase [Hyphomonas oceanitis]KDA01037.1 N-acetyltransferase GCN5 [Hyphomonas oceanitis SCH89]